MLFVSSCADCKDLWNIRRTQRRKPWDRQCWSKLKGLLLFCVVLFGNIPFGARYYANYMLGYGPIEAASEHGGKIDLHFNITGILYHYCFAICHLATFLLCLQIPLQTRAQSHVFALMTNWNDLDRYSCICHGNLLSKVFCMNEIMATPSPVMNTCLLKDSLAICSGILDIPEKTDSWALRILDLTSPVVMI